MRRMNGNDPLFEKWLTGEKKVQFAIIDTIRGGEDALLCTDERDHPISNAAYRHIGYLKIGEIHEFAFY